MDCQKVSKLISPYLDGELSTDKHTMVAGHLAVCPSCQLQFLEWQALAQELKYSLESLKAPDDLLPIILTQSSLQKQNQQVAKVISLFVGILGIISGLGIVIVISPLGLVYRFVFNVLLFLSRGLYFVYGLSGTAWTVAGISLAVFFAAFAGLLLVRIMREPQREAIP